ncbi:MAG: Fic family protein [Microthrixaceae bacterium]
MRSFLDRRVFGAVPASLVRALADVDAGRGREEFLRARAPGRLDELARRARTESVIGSSAIEGIVVPRGRAETVLGGAGAPRTDDELELAGYQRALDDVYQSPVTVLTVPRLLGWHRAVLQGTRPDIAGHLKRFDNKVVDTRPDGSIVERFPPVSAAATPTMLRELVERYEDSRQNGLDHPLFLVAAVVLDFLVIHPFEDGNGRVARLLTNALAEREGYSVGRYRSIEALVAGREAEYLDALAASTRGWHRNEHTIWPWTEFLVSIFAQAYVELEETSKKRTPEQRRTEVEGWLDSRAPAEFTMSEARHALPGIPPEAIREVLNQRRIAGSIALTGHGRGARWLQLPA